MGWSISLPNPFAWVESVAGNVLHEVAPVLQEVGNEGKDLLHQAVATWDRYDTWVTVGVTVAAAIVPGLQPVAFALAAAELAHGSLKLGDALIGHDWSELLDGAEDIGEAFTGPFARLLGKGVVPAARVLLAAARFSRGLSTAGTKVGEALGSFARGDGGHFLTAMAGAGAAAFMAFSGQGGVLAEALEDQAGKLVEFANGLPGAAIAASALQSLRGIDGQLANQIERLSGAFLAEIAPAISVEGAVGARGQTFLAAIAGQLPEPVAAALSHLEDRVAGDPEKIETYGDAGMLTVDDILAAFADPACFQAHLDKLVDDATPDLAQVIDDASANDASPLATRLREGLVAYHLWKTEAQALTNRDPGAGVSALAAAEGALPQGDRQVVERMAEREAKPLEERLLSPFGRRRPRASRPLGRMSPAHRKTVPLGAAELAHLATYFSGMTASGEEDLG